MCYCSPFKKLHKTEPLPSHPYMFEIGKPPSIFWMMDVQMEIFNPSHLTSLEMFLSQLQFRSPFY